MQKSTFTHLILCLAIVTGGAACGSSFAIQDVDYSQPVESVLTPDGENMIHDQRYAVKFSISALLEEEGISRIEELRMIRNRTGFYYLTAGGFRHVYILEPEENTLKLAEKLMVSENGLTRPAFNQRGTYIELIDSATGETFNLD